jgi:hypothetical protein
MANRALALHTSDDRVMPLKVCDTVGNLAQVQKVNVEELD